MPRTWVSESPRSCAIWASLKPCSFAVRRVAASSSPAWRTNSATKIDPWFLDQIVLINEVAEFVRQAGELDAATLRVAKEHGFSDVQIGQLRGFGEAEVREVRHILDVRPVYKTVDTCAGEFPALTPYLSLIHI